MEKYVGTYQVTKKENLMAFLDELDAKFLPRTHALTVNRRVVISVLDDGRISITNSMINLKPELVFRLGVEFIEERIDNHEPTTIIRMEGDNKLIKEQSSKNVSVVREFFENGMIETYTCRNISCKRTYKIYVPEPEPMCD